MANITHRRCEKVCKESDESLEKRLCESEASKTLCSFLTHPGMLHRGELTLIIPFRLWARQYIALLPSILKLG